VWLYQREATMTNPKEIRKEEKETHKLKQENLKLVGKIKELQIKHNQLLAVLSSVGLNIQILCTQNRIKL